MSGSDNIILAGFMGSGKSTVAEIVASRLGIVVADTDDLIVEEAGMEIPEIFGREGETGFRNREEEMVRRVTSDGERKVIALGGGALLREANREVLKAAGTLFYLKVSAEVATERLASVTDRPLLKGRPLEESVRELLAERVEVYESCCEHEIDTDGLTAEEVAERVVSILEPGPEGAEEGAKKGANKGAKGKKSKNQRAR